MSFYAREVSKKEIVLEITGSLDGENLEILLEELNALMNSSYKAIILDLSKISSCNITRFSKILYLHERLKSQNRRIDIYGCHSSLYNLLKQSKLSGVIDIHKEPPKKKYLSFFLSSLLYKSTQVSIEGPSTVRTEAGIPIELIRQVFAAKRTTELQC